MEREPGFSRQPEYDGSSITKTGLDAQKKTIGALERDKVQRLFEAKGAHLLFLPAYSPDLSPIEYAFSKIKQALRRAKAQTLDALMDAIAQALAAVSWFATLGWFANSGFLNPP